MGITCSGRGEELCSAISNGDFFARLFFAFPLVAAEGRNQNTKDHGMPSAYVPQTERKTGQKNKGTERYGKRRPCWTGGRSPKSIFLSLYFSVQSPPVGAIGHG